MQRDLKIENPVKLQCGRFIAEPEIQLSCHLGGWVVRFNVAGSLLNRKLDESQEQEAAMWLQCGRFIAEPEI